MQNTINAESLRQMISTIEGAIEAIKQDKGVCIRQSKENPQMIAFIPFRDLEDGDYVYSPEGAKILLEPLEADRLILLSQLKELES